MQTLGTPTATIEILRKYNHSAQKKYGQNFLIDQNILEGIVDAAEINEDDMVLEIGPGLGSMTQILSERARKVIAVEIDKDLIPILQETLRGCDNVQVINQDILKMDIAGLVESENGGKPIKVVANLPYYITTPIITELLESRVPLLSITVMVQKEVADRMKVGPGTKDYGALSLAVQYYSKPEIMLTVPASCFIPRPNVDSAVIKLSIYDTPRVVVKDEKLLFALIRASFNQRRKTLVNGLTGASIPGIDKDKVLAALEEMGESATVRGETFTLEQFGRLADLLS